MLINILDKNLHQIDIIDDAQSVIWTKSLWTPGDFEITTIANEKNINKFKIGYFLTRDDDDTVMIIEGMEIKTDATEGNILFITGRSYESIFSYRVIVNKAYAKWPNGYGWFYELLNYLIGSSLGFEGETDTHFYPNEGEITHTTKRRINTYCGARLWQFETIGGALTRNFYTANLSGDYLTIVMDACKEQGVSIKCVIDNIPGPTPLDKVVTVPIIPEDRSETVIFSKEYGNLLRSVYKKDVSDFYNVAIVYGQGEGSERDLKEVFIGSAQFDEEKQPIEDERRELFVDARDISMNSESEGMAQDVIYEEDLIRRGWEKLSEKSVQESFSGEIDPETQFKYKEDYFLGDIVTVENEFGITSKVRIVSVTECEDSTGYYYIPKYENVEV